MSILRVRDTEGNVQEILAIRGEPGKTPIKGEDYFTDDDISSMVSEVSEFAILKTKTYIATTDNIIDVIKNAQPYSTIMLSEGEYGLIQLVGISSFPEGLTITCEPVSGKANPNVKVAGIDISGSMTNSDTWLTDLTAAKLNGKLTIRYITFTDSVCVRNCIIDGVVIRDCNVTNGAISVTPNRFNSKHYAITSGQRSEKWSMQVTTSKNIVVRNCTISGYDEMYSKKYGIFIECCENVFTYGNTLENGGTNGIYICGLNARATAGGRVSISKNTVKNTTGASIYVNKLTDANIHITSNTLYDSGADAKRHIVVSGCLNTLTQFNRRDADGHNVYKDTVAGTSVTMNASGTGYVVESSTSYVKSDAFATHTSSFNSYVSAFNTHKNTFNSHVTAFNNHVNNETNFHGLDSSKIVLTERIINVAPEDVPDSATFSEIIKNAQEGSIIQLAAGSYPRLNLKGKDAFRNNVTIRGYRTRDDGSEYVLSNYEKHTIIDGVAISSNAEPFANIYDPSGRASDITAAIMSSNLRFEHLIFDSSFSLVNADITGLALYDCVFNAGTYAQICANKVNNCFNDYASWADTYVNFPSDRTRYAHNVLVSHCHFIDARTDTTTELGAFVKSDSMSAIYLEAVDGATVTGNIIDKAAYNGIQITGTYTANRFGAKSKGKIVVTGNTVSYTGSRSIRMSNLENAEIIMLWNHMYHKGNIPTEDDAEAAKISCDLTSTLQTMFSNGKTSSETNTYADAILSKVTTKDTFGIFLDQTKTYNSVITDLQSQINALQTQLNNLIVASSEFDPDNSATYPENAKFVVRYEEDADA